MSGDSFICMRVEFAGKGVLLDRGVESFGVETLEPCAKPRELAGRKFFDSLLDIFSGGHVGDIAVWRDR